MARAAVRAYPGFARGHGGRPSRARTSVRTRSAIRKADCICRVLACLPG
jgi:hypothetical protein